MKHLKKFENYDQEYDDIFNILVDKLHNKILSDKKNINGFYPYQQISGSIAWTKNNFMCYATPYWEEELSLPIEINIDGEYIEADNTEFELIQLRDESDIDRVLVTYYDIISKITSQLDDRKEFVKMIAKLQKYYTNIEINTTIDVSGEDVFIGNIQKYENSDISLLYNNISSETFVELLNILKERYPEINTIEDFNL